MSSRKVEAEEVLAEVLEAEEVTYIKSPSKEVSVGNDDHANKLPSNLVDEENVANDPLCIAVRSNEESGSLYDIIIEQVAREAAIYKSLRDEASDLAGKAIVTEKRIQALEKASKLVSLRNKEMRDKNGGKIDFTSENFQRVLELIVQLIQQAVEEAGVREAEKSRFFLKLQQKLTGFEDLADQAYKGTSKKDASKNAAEFAKTRG